MGAANRWKENKQNNDDTMRNKRKLDLRESRENKRLNEDRCEMEEKEVCMKTRRKKKSEDDINGKEESKDNEEWLKKSLK